jgi:hypothetical protein
MTKYIYVSAADIKRGAYILKTQGEAAHRKWLKDKFGAYTVRKPTRRVNARAMGGTEPTRSKA